MIRIEVCISACWIFDMNSFYNRCVSTKGMRRNIISYSRLFRQYKYIQYRAFVWLLNSFLPLYYASAYDMKMRIPLYDKEKICQYSNCWFSVLLNMLDRTMLLNLTCPYADIPSSPTALQNSFSHFSPTL